MVREVAIQWRRSLQPDQGWLEHLGRPVQKSPGTPTRDGEAPTHYQTKVGWPLAHQLPGLLEQSQLFGSAGWPLVIGEVVGWPATEPGRWNTHPALPRLALALWYWRQLPQQAEWWGALIRSPAARAAVCGAGELGRVVKGWATSSTDGTPASSLSTSSWRTIWAQHHLTRHKSERKSLHLAPWSGRQLSSIQVPGHPFATATAGLSVTLYNGSAYSAQRQGLYLIFKTKESCIASTNVKGKHHTDFNEVGLKLICSNGTNSMTE